MILLFVIVLDLLLFLLETHDFYLLRSAAEFTSPTKTSWPDMQVQANKRESFSFGIGVTTSLDSNVPFAGKLITFTPAVYPEKT